MIGMIPMVIPFFGVLQGGLVWGFLQTLAIWSSLRYLEGVLSNRQWRPRRRILSATYVLTLIFRCDMCWLLSVKCVDFDFSVQVKIAVKAITWNFYNMRRIMMRQWLGIVFSLTIQKLSCRYDKKFNFVISFFLYEPNIHQFLDLLDTKFCQCHMDVLPLVIIDNVWVVDERWNLKICNQY